MIERIGFEDLVARAEKLISAKVPWHFHVLSASCTLIDDAHGLAMVLEDGYENKQYIADLPEDQMSVSRRLASEQHGADMFGHVTSSNDDESLDGASELLDAAHTFAQDEVPFHHHMLTPTCAFNSFSGYTLMLEGNGEVISYGQTTEPRRALAELERLFYAQKTVG